MEISEKLSQQRLQEILLHTYVKGHETEDINIKEFIEEIKIQILADTYHRG